MNEPGTVRFTAWISERESAMLDELKAEHGSSKNYVVRGLIRAGLGLPSPAWLRERYAELAERERERLAAA